MRWACVWVVMIRLTCIDRVAKRSTDRRGMKTTIDVKNSVEIYVFATFQYNLKFFDMILSTLVSIIFHNDI